MHLCHFATFQGEKSQHWVGWSYWGYPSQDLDRQGLKKSHGASARQILPLRLSSKRKAACEILRGSCRELPGNFSLISAWGWTIPKDGLHEQELWQAFWPRYWTLSAEEMYPKWVLKESIPQQNLPRQLWRWGLQGKGYRFPQESNEEVQGCLATIQICIVKSWQHRMLPLAVRRARGSSTHQGIDGPREGGCQCLPRE